METRSNKEFNFKSDLERTSSIYSKPNEENTHHHQIILPPLIPQPNNTIKPNLPSIKELISLTNLPSTSTSPHHYTSSRSHSYTSRRSSTTPIPLSPYHPSTTLPYHQHQLPFFISAIEKQARRKFHQIDRTFKCIHPNCQKSYGALNHLNSHIVTQNHGRRRKAHEFKEGSSIRR